MRFRHVALYADDLRDAETFYAQAFDADVLFRESVDSDGVWYTLPLGATWEDAERAGVELHFSVLARDEMLLPIFAGESVRRIVGVQASVEEIAEMRGRLPERATVLAADEANLVFTDPFEVEWQVHADPRFRHSGELHGRWLALART